MRINLAALTTDELQRLLGPDGALAALPALEGQRLTGRPVVGPEPQGLGLSPKVRHPSLRSLGAAGKGLKAIKAVPAYCGAAFLAGEDTTLSLGECGLFALSLLKGGEELGVLSYAAAQALTPTPSEAVICYHLPTLDLGSLLAAHRVQVSRHGKALPLDPEKAGAAWEAVAAANHATWSRRGLLLEEPKPPVGLPTPKGARV